LRHKRGLTQPLLVAKLNLLGWNISRETLAKIELRIRWIADAELVCLAKSLGVSLESFLPDQPTAAMKAFHLVDRRTKSRQMFKRNQTLPLP
jgi:transcriptional regulator with XRE-family HTH domain